jgi:hypothetical protein
VVPPQSIEISHHVALVAPDATAHDPRPTLSDDPPRPCPRERRHALWIFRQIQRPRVDVLESLAAGLEVGVHELHVSIGVIDSDADTPTLVHRSGQAVTLIWPS